VTIDVGTGDGRAVWRWARDEPARLAIGIDANASGMGPAARRAARPKTLRPNALFVVASAESLPHELAGVADRVTVQFPWGSLLRGVIAGDGNVLDNLAMIAAPGAALTVLWSVVDRDRGRVGSVPPRPSEERFGAAGFDVCEARPATAADVAAAGSTWAKRLRAGVDRPASLLRAVRR
jgi:16S rRNA (adenine(1408)-N(1))-methyltransferase